MNNAEAKTIPLSLYVEYIGGRHSHIDRKRENWYFSPFRPDEHTASFKINEQQTRWHDFGLSGSAGFTKRGDRQPSGGDIADLWCDWNFKDRRLANKEALQALAELFPKYTRVQPLSFNPRLKNPSVEKKPPTFKILKIANYITHFGLKDELQRRKISLELANLYLKQGHILNTVTNGKYYAFLFPNDKGGYEVSIPNPKRGECFKTCIGPKGSTYLKPSKASFTGEVYEGFWDPLSWLEMKKLKQPIHHTWSLNSNSFANEVVEKIINSEEEIDCVLLFLDNDLSGRNTTHAMALALEKHNKVVGSMESEYDGYKDVSDCRMGIPSNNQ